MFSERKIRLLTTTQEAGQMKMKKTNKGTKGGESK
jgi:hypothetical protein